MNQEEFHKILKRYRQGKASNAEQKLIETWYERIGTDDIQEDIELSLVGDKYWKNINAHLKTTPKTDKLKQRKLFVHTSFFRIAASLIFLMGTVYLFYKAVPSESIDTADKTSSEITSVLNTDAVIKQIALPDGSTIALNPGSQIDFVESFNAPTREVYLKGEAFFSVKRDESRPFIVYSNEVMTKVLGTSFWIKALDEENDVTVSVSTGKVCVYTKSRDKKELDAVVIAPNQQIVFNRDELKVKKGIVPEPAPIAEIRSTTIRKKFEGTSVLQIFGAIEEMYGLKIQADEINFKNCTLTTTLFEDELFKRLDIICQAIGATYRVEETTIIIEGPGCE